MLSNGAQMTLDQTREALRTAPKGDERYDLQTLRFPNTTVAVVCICAAAFGNQEKLEHTLLQLTHIRLDPKFWRIVVFCNWPRSAEPDKCIEVVQRLKRLLPNLDMIAKAVPDRTPIALIRRMLHDTVSVNAQRAGIDDIVHITMDADTVRVHPDLVLGFIRRLRQTHADACVGQLDWDHDDPHLNSRTLPALRIGNALTGLLPLHGNHRIIASATDHHASDPNVLLEAIFSPSFRHGSHCNFAFTDSAYNRAGRYGAEECDEFPSLLRRMWLYAYANRGQVDSLCFGSAKDGTVVVSDARRALWGIEAGEPVMCQWKVRPFQNRDGIRTGLPPNLTRHTSPSFDVIERHINLTFDEFHMPEGLLAHAVQATFHDMGLDSTDYDLMLRPHEPDPVLHVAQAKLKQRGYERLIGTHPVHIHS